jgi:hypothetical protein
VRVPRWTTNEGPGTDRGPSTTDQGLAFYMEPKNALV